MTDENGAKNILKHELCPEHILLSPEEADEVLKTLGVGPEQLPKIRKDDAAIKALERTRRPDGMPIGPIPIGSIIKVIRESETAGRSIAYRVVTG